MRCLRSCSSGSTSPLCQCKLRSILCTCFACVCGRGVCARISAVWRSEPMWGKFRIFNAMRDPRLPPPTPPRNHGFPCTCAKLLTYTRAQARSNAYVRTRTHEHDHMPETHTMCTDVGFSTACASALARLRLAKLN